MSATIDWSAPADLYSSIAVFKTVNSRYMRFPSAAEAVRFVVEEMPAASLRGVALESGDDRYEGEAIRALYHALNYPLRRNAR